METVKFYNLEEEQFWISRINHFENVKLEMLKMETDITDKAEQYADDLLLEYRKRKERIKQF